MDALLNLFTGLENEDLDWILSQACEQKYMAHIDIINEGEVPEALYIVLQGLLEIKSSSSGATLSLLGPGEIVGEMTLLEMITASETVSTIEPSILLAIPREQIFEKLRDDTAFAARFFKSLAIQIARRLRESNGKLGLELSKEEGVDLRGQSKAVSG